MASPSEWFGFLNVDKPAGWTSRKVVDHVQRLVRPAKAGHAGTLDPLAEGVLVVCLGPATRLVPSLHELPKAYRGEFLCGRSSDTDDIEGDVRELEDAPALTRSQLLDVFPRFVGRIAQTPPIYSAVKVKGRRAYTLARRGELPDLQPRNVEIYRLELIEFDQPRMVLDIECSSGTYVRSLGRDIARAAGSDAVMSGLIRTRIGSFRREAAVSPEEITRDSIARLMIPASAAVSHFTTVVCDDDALDHLRHGRTMACPPSIKPDDGETCAAVSVSGRLVAIGEFHASGAHIAPRHVFP
ncbi:MAG: tRNA pseudouridine(55) synthase TruB [Planctomycetaceae bacterium]